MESSSDSDNENVPWEISNIAAAATAQLLPEKSKSRYENVYDSFTKWMEMKQCKIITEDVMLAYLAHKSETVKSSTLWSMYSMLKSTILVKKNVNIAIFPKVLAFLKRKNVGYKAKKSEVFSSEQISKFIREADNDTYLMLKVLPGLYVGNYRDSKDANQLNKNKITHILAIHDTARRIHSDKHYLCVMASDSPDQNLAQYFSLCNDFIHAARLRGGNVLIHCLAGMSRSVTVAVAYIMTVTNLNWKEALKVVKAGRSVANPNLGFQKQLQEFETLRVGEERRRLKERYPSLALVKADREQCMLMLENYEELLQSRSICEGRCALGEECPTGLCRSTPQRKRSSRNSVRSKSEISRSPSTMSNKSTTSTTSNTSRPRSGPPGLRSYTGSTPPSRSGSRVDISSLGGSGSRTTPSTPQGSPPISPKRSLRKPISVPLALHEDEDL